MARSEFLSGSGDGRGGFEDGDGFDGIICIGGEDWWYHNRGHFDFQIMRRLAKRWPVLFVNSLGVRMPGLSDSRVFAQRIGRKLKSLSRGLVEAEPGFFVFSPVTAPGRLAEQMASWALAPQIRLASRRAGLKRPLLWVHCPAGAKLTQEIPAAGVVMQRTDRFEAFPEADPELVGSQIAHLKSRADLVVYAAPHLMMEEKDEVQRQLLVTHGVDFDAFLAAGLEQDRLRLPGSGDRCGPADMEGIARPRIGFIGGVDRHTFDPDLYISVAGLLPQMQFVMVGGCSLPEDWCQLANVHQLGRKPYDEVASYMAAMDVLIMPWNKSDWIAGCNPIKLKEYLAVGRPVVTTDFAALDPWRDLVSVADGAEDFATAITRAVEQPFDASAGRSRVRFESWDAKGKLVGDALVELASELRSRVGSKAA
ncbi:MAG: glycosyltransferase [Alphaproteobacteria bacterium]|nr:glycosyltransferase [Alphaproteobacteria bacterium]